MGTDDYASAYMAAEAAYNSGDYGPMRELLAENFKTEQGQSRDEFIEGLRTPSGRSRRPDSPGSGPSSSTTGWV